MAYPITLTVRYANQAYSCRFPNGKTASSTMDAQTAVERLMDKVWALGTHRAVKTRECTSVEPGEWQIYPMERTRHES